MSRGLPRRAAEIAPSITGSDDTLVCAAWLHEIGYAPSLVVTGFHPLDGARFLARAGASHRLAALVAHHSYAALEAGLRGLAAKVAEFDDEGGPVRDALWYCDLTMVRAPSNEAAIAITTSPDGEPVRATERIAEIKHRYGTGHLVTRFITLATTDLLAAVDRTEQQLSTR
jgi:hypothetical protein